MKNIAIILAGGAGQRLGAVLPKQFLKVAGKTVIEHTLQTFEQNSRIDEIAVVIHPGYVHEMENISARNSFTKLRKILAGGKERYESSLAAIRAYSGEDVNLLFHDAVRPLVSDRIINDCIDALQTYHAVDVAIPTTDTIIEVDEQSHICTIPNRNRLRNGQTPQAFRLQTIQAAYDLALQDPNFQTTDDCGVVLKYLPDEPVYVVRGEQFNIKLTYKEDIFLLDKLFQLKSKASDTQHTLPENILQNKVLVVLGGTEGIGLAIKNLAQSLGAQVFSTSRREGVNVADQKSVSEFLNQVVQQAGKIDFVVNTAGILDKQALHNMSYDVIQAALNVNLLGSIVCAKESFPYLKDSHGMLLMFTSSSYTRGRALYSIYSSTKAAIVNLTQALAEEWLPENVSINCINPERTATPMRTRSFGVEPAGSLLSAEEVAIAAIQTLVSQETGQVIDVKRRIA